MDCSREPTNKERYGYAFDGKHAVYNVATRRYVQSFNTELSARKAVDVFNTCEIKLADRWPSHVYVYESNEALFKFSFWSIWGQG